MKIPAIIFTILLAATQALQAETIGRFRMDNEACPLGLSALSNLSKIDIQTQSPPRRTIRNCTIKSVRITLPDPHVEFLAERMVWNRQGLAPLIDGLLPQHLRLELDNVRIISAPKNNPAWTYLARSGVGGRKFDALLALTYDSETGLLNLSGASIDFGNGNRMTLTAKLRGVNPTLPQTPNLSALAIVVQQASFIIQSGMGRENPAIGVGMAMLRHEIAPEGMEHFKDRAIIYVDEKLQDRLPQNSRRALKNLIAQMPRPKGDIVLQLDTDDGFGLIGLGLLRKGADPIQVLGGLGASFDYGPGIAK